MHIQYYINANVLIHETYIEDLEIAIDSKLAFVPDIENRIADLQKCWLL